MWKAGVVLVVAIVFLASCTKDKTGNNQCPPCPDTVSFKAVIIPIFAGNCAIPGCHDASSDKFSLNLDSVHAFAAVTEPGTGNVYAGNATNSVLYQVINGGGMPPNGSLPPLTSCDIEEIGCWINQGAKNN